MEGMGYAISVEEAWPVIQELIASGRVARPDLGASLYTVDESLAARYRLAVSQGALVTQVVKGGPADGAGIRAGDVIIAIGEIEVTSAPSCLRALQEFGVGASVAVTFYRGNNKETVTLTLGRSV